MKIHLVNPSCAIEEGRDLYTNDVATALFTMRPFKRLALGMPLALPTLAAHTPSQHQVKIIDEEIEDIDFQEPVDLVGITAMSFKAKRAYEIAHEYRRHGAAVVLGGIHASMCPDEALQHVDSVVIGEAEDIWPAVVSDAESGQLKKIYRADGFPELERANIPRYDLVKNKRYGYSYLQTTRGCPYSCKFCTVTKQNGHKVRKKRPEQVVAELDALLKLRPKKEFILRDRSDGRCKRFVGNIAFIDDNFAIDRDHALSVCHALKTYQEENNCIIGWYTQVNVNIGFDEELLQAMVGANCWHVFIGIESIDPEILRRMNKNMNLPKRYAEALENIQRVGIVVVASTIIGEEGTDWGNVAALKAFIEDNNILHVLVNILTPYVGTQIYEQLAREQRLITRNPQKYNIRNVVFRPKKISKEQLEEMYVWLCRSIFDCRASYRRGKKLLSSVDRYSLPYLVRPPAFAGFLFSMLILMLRGRIRFSAAFWAFFRMPHLLLSNGSFFAIELLTMCLDYDNFSRREEKRFLSEGISLTCEDSLLGAPRRIVRAIRVGGKRYKIFYLDGFELRRFGFMIPPENIHRPVLLLGGTSIPVSDRTRLIKSFLEAGYEVASIENPLGGPFDFRINPVRERSEALQDYLAHLRNDDGIREITIVAQSYSAFEVVRVLIKDPLEYRDFVKSIILINPPGFDEGITAARHIFRFFWNHVIRGYFKPRSKHPDKEGFKRKERIGILTWTGKSLSNIVRSLREVDDIVHYRVKAPLKELIGYGYQIRFFIQTEDQVVPAGITLKHARELVPETDIECVAGGHNDLFFQEWQRKSFIEFFSKNT